jgi:hypothetical protein
MLFGPSDVEFHIFLFTCQTVWTKTSTRSTSFPGVFLIANEIANEHDVASPRDAVLQSCCGGCITTFWNAKTNDESYAIRIWKAS